MSSIQGRQKMENKKNNKKNPKAGEKNIFVKFM